MRLQGGSGPASSVWRHAWRDFLCQNPHFVSRSAFYTNTFLSVLLGNMFNYTLVILSNHISSSDSFAGMVFASITFPSLLVTFAAGLLLDRFSRLKVLLGAQASSNAAIFILALLTYQGLLSFQSRYLLLATALMQGIALAAVIPSRFAFLGNIFPKERIGQATFHLNVLIILGYGLAPVAAGILKQFLPWEQMLLSMALLYSAALLLFVLMRSASVPVPAPDSASDSAAASDSRVAKGAAVAMMQKIDLRGGFRLLKERPLILEVLGFSFAGFFMIGPIQVLMPRFAKSIFMLSELERGLLLGMLGAGLLIGASLASIIHHSSRRGLAIGVIVAIIGILMTCLAWVDGPLPAALLLGAIGICGGVNSGMVPAILQESVSEQFRGRVMGYYSLLYLVTPALSGFAMGFMAEFAGIRGAFLISGALVALFSIAGIYFLEELRSFR